MVCLVNDEHVGLFLHALDFLGKVPGAHEVGVIEDAQVAEALEEMREVFAEVALPHGDAPRLGHDEDDFLAVVNQPLDEQQADEGFAKADAVAQQRAAMLVGNLEQ